MVHSHFLSEFYCWFLLSQYSYYYSGQTKVKIEVLDPQASKALVFSLLKTYNFVQHSTSQLFFMSPSLAFLLLLGLAMNLFHLEKKFPKGSYIKFIVVQVCFTMVGSRIWIQLVFFTPSVFPVSRTYGWKVTSQFTYVSHYCSWSPGGIVSWWCCAVRHYARSQTYASLCPC